MTLKPAIHRKRRRETGAADTSVGDPKSLKSRSSTADRMVMILALFLPCRYLWPLSASYNVEWNHTRWAIGYFGEYFRRHGVMPDAFNTAQWGGIAAPIFYGNLAYPILGVFSSIIAADIVLRLAVVLLFAAQYICVLNALRRLEASRLVSHAVACLVIWATYPLTNLFNRSAIMEFFATSLLVCALGLAILLVNAPSKARENRYASRMMLCLVISAGSHPITAMFGVPFFCVLGAVWWGALRANPERRRSMLRLLAPAFIGAIACLGAWLYATAKFMEHLAIRYTMSSVIFLTGAWDWRTRFYPIPFDSRVQPGIPRDEIWVPYLDDQINLSVLVLFLVLSGVALSVGRELHALTSVLMVLAVSVSLFGFFTWISLSPGSYHYLPSMVGMIQFAYRAVTYQNLALLLGVFLVLMAARSSLSGRFATILAMRLVTVVTVACLLLSAYGVVVKWPRIRAARSSRGSDSIVIVPNQAQRQTLIQLPDNYYSIADYTTPDRYVALTGDEMKNAVPVTFPFQSRAGFGTPQPLEVGHAEVLWARTNIQAFPWNRIEIDGQEVAESDVRAYDRVGIALRLPAGPHRLLVKFVPDAWWKLLRNISLITLWGWLVAEFAISAIQRGKGVKR